VLIVQPFYFDIVEHVKSGNKTNNKGTELTQRKTTTNFTKAMTSWFFFFTPCSISKLK